MGVGTQFALQIYNIMIDTHNNNILMTLSVFHFLLYFQ
jgi:hypothetical protein